jgi:hypothetical protein
MQIFDNDKWTYCCSSELNTKHSNQKTSVVHIRDVNYRFVQAGNINKGKSTAKLPESQEVVEN